MQKFSIILDRLTTKMKATILVGCSASGKSTYVDSLDESTEWIEINRDEIRKQLLNTTKSGTGYSDDQNMWKFWNFSWEKDVTKIVDNYIQYWAKAGTDIICSDTNINQDRRNALIKKLEDLGYEVDVIVFGKDLSLDELWKRDNFRKDSVGFQIIAKQYQEFRKQYPKYQLKDTDGKPCVIFDVDGTLTRGPENRSAYEWDKVSQDLPRLNLFNTMVTLKNEGYKIIVLSGRDSVCREDTFDWLAKWFNFVTDFYNDHEKFPQFELYMRPENDMRSDIDVKLELFFNHIDGKYNVCAVYDDRPKVIRNVWLELGFDTYCVGNQYVEF